jgi:hypothetical protein
LIENAGPLKREAVFTVSSHLGSGLVVWRAQHRRALLKRHSWQFASALKQLGTELALKLKRQNHGKDTSFEWDAEFAEIRWRLCGKEVDFS